MIIADTPDGLTPAWLSEVLGGAGVLDEARITAVDATPIGTGQMCDSLRLRLSYDRETAAPPTMIAKLPAADPNSRAAALSLRSYEIEVRFYQQLAPALPVRTPAVHHADIDIDTANFVLLLEDLAPARPGDQLLGCSAEEAASAVDELVKLHAPRWADPSLSQLEWLHRDPGASRTFLLDLLPGLWAGFRERYSDQLEPEVLDTAATLFSHLEQHLSADTAPWTVIHGDYRLDNLLFADGDGEGPVRVAVVDWQTCGHGPALNDVAYFVGAGLLPDVRRAHEHDLVRRYHQRLVAAGVGDYDWDRCWRDYRRGTWAGLIMAIAASMLVRRTERGDEMFMTMARRHARHAVDLDAPALLGR